LSAACHHACHHVSDAILQIKAWLSTEELPDLAKRSTATWRLMLLLWLLAKHARARVPIFKQSAQLVAVFCFLLISEWSSIGAIILQSHSCQILPLPLFGGGAEVRSASPPFFCCKQQQK